MLEPPKPDRGRARNLGDAGIRRAGIGGASAPRDSSEFLLPRPKPRIDRRALGKLRRGLERYAQWLLNNKPMNGPIGQLLAEDLASDAIICAFENLVGKTTSRRWDPASCTMATFCRGHIRSRIYNSRNSQEQILGKDIAGSWEEVVIADESQDPASLLELRNLYQVLCASLSGDELAMLVLKALLEEADPSTSAIAARLGRSEADVTNARQRIFRNGHKVARGQYD